MSTRLPPIYAVVLDAKEVERHPQTTFRSTEEAFGKTQEQIVGHALAIQRFKRPAKAPQLVRGVVGASLIALALVGLLSIVRAIH